MREHNLQVAVAHMLQVVLDPERTWWSALDHAAKLSPRYGGERKRRGVKPGLPDFMIMFGGNGQIIGIELKTDKGRLTPDQTQVSIDWGSFGNPIYVARSLEEVQEILEHCRIPLRTRMTIFPQLKVPHEYRCQVATSRHSRPGRRRKPKNHLPLVLADAAQKN